MSIVNFNDGLGDVPTAYTEMFIKGSAANSQGCTTSGVTLRHPGDAAWSDVHGSASQ